MVQIDMGKPARCIDCPLIPETHEKRMETHACDPEYNMDEWCTDCTEYGIEDYEPPY